MLRDLKSKVDISPTLYGVAASATGTAPDAGVDLRGYDSCVLIASAGAIAGSGLFYPKAVESDDNITFTDVAAADLEGAFLTAGMVVNTVERIGYKGSKRYVGIVPVKVSGTSLVLTGLVLRGKSHVEPL